MGNITIGYLCDNSRPAVTELNREAFGEAGIGLRFCDNVFDAGELFTREPFSLLLVNPHAKLGENYGHVVQLQRLAGRDSLERTLGTAKYVIQAARHCKSPNFQTPIIVETSLARTPGFGGTYDAFDPHQIFLSAGADRVVVIGSERYTEQLVGITRELIEKRAATAGN
jgi:hypothetical protein